MLRLSPLEWPAAILRAAEAGVRVHGYFKRLAFFAPHPRHETGGVVYDRQSTEPNELGREENTKELSSGAT